MKYYLKKHVPVNPFFHPDCSNMHYHKENKYGLFKTTGRL